MPLELLKLFGGISAYKQFVSDLVAEMLKQMSARTEPEFISQRKACELFGRRNVERWRREGKITFFKRPGKVEYRLEDLRRLQATPQDYMDFKASSLDED